MICSTSAKYAVMALIELAAREGSGPVQIREVSEQTGIPHQFLAKIVQTLVKAGIVMSSKGRGGGIQLAKPAAEISIVAVLRAIDGDAALNDCMFGLGKCDGTRQCPVHQLWGPIRDQILAFLEDTTLEELSR